MANDPNRQGELEDGHGFAVGTASADARPTTIDGGFRATVDDNAGPLSPSKQATFAESDFVPPPLDRNDAYTMFKDKDGPGYDDNLLLVEAKRKLKDLKQRAKEASSDVNANKQTIDELKGKLEDLKQRAKEASSDVNANKQT